MARTPVIAPPRKRGMANKPTPGTPQIGGPLPPYQPNGKAPAWNKGGTPQIGGPLPPDYSGSTKPSRGPKQPEAPKPQKPVGGAKPPRGGNGGGRPSNNGGFGYGAAPSAPKARGR